MGSVFINYRRGETAGEARALFNELANTVGKSAVFMDVDNIALGRDFRQVLQERLASCDLMLALIGRDWVDGKDKSGLRRLDDPSDYVCLEIEAALKRNIPITPVLVQNAQMPTIDQLPEKIKDFAYRNGFELSHNRWESDVQEMFKRLGLRSEQNAKARRELETRTKKTHTETLMEDARGFQAQGTAVQPAVRKPWFAMLGAVVIALAVAGGGFLYYRMDAADKASMIEQEQLSARARADAESELAAARAEAEKARADAEAARKAREQIEADNAKAAAAQAAKERAAAAAQLKREQAAARAEKDRAAAAQEERNREAAAQAERDRAARESAKAAKDNAMAQSPSSGAPPARAPKFSGSMTHSMGVYARSHGLNQSELTTSNTMGACSRWAQELQLSLDEGRSFRSVCMSLADYANANGWQLGRRPSAQELMKYCHSKAGQLTGDVRKRLISICLKYG